MKLYEQLLGGKVAWSNTVIMVTKIDYNSLKHDNEQEWLEEVK